MLRCVLVPLITPGDEEQPALLLWEYNRDLFSEETASHMVRHLLTLLAASLDDPEQLVAELPMLSPDERKSIIEMCSGNRSFPHRTLV
jgi:non-ribosomal peptide synthetase component F